jgi:heat shock protein HtpX
MNRRIDTNGWFVQKIKNGMHTFMLLAGMLLLVSMLGWFFAGMTGMLWVLSVTAASLLVAPGLSLRLILRWYGARPLAPQQAPSLHANLRELTRRAKLPNMPTLIYVPTATLGAFTTGSRHHAVIAVTDGLLRRLNDRELTAVMAHEISHLKNNDLRMMTVSATFSQITSILSAIGQVLFLLNLPLILISEQHVSWFGILFLIMAPTLAMILQLALSRTREFDADLGAAELTGDPKGLASALLKIENDQRGWLGMLRWSGPSRPYDALWNTHPATRDRVKRLMAVAQRPSLHPTVRHRRTTAGIGNIAMPVRILRMVA